MSAPHAELIRRRFDIAAIRFSEVTLKSGITWPFGVDERERAGPANGSPIRPSREFLPATRVA